MPTLGKVFVKQNKLVSKHPAKGHISVPRKFIGKEFDVIMIPRFNVSEDANFLEGMIAKTIEMKEVKDESNETTQVKQTESGM